MIPARALRTGAIQCVMKRFDGLLKRIFNPYLESVRGGDPFLWHKRSRLLCGQGNREHKHEYGAKHSHNPPKRERLIIRYRHSNPLADTDSLLCL